MARKKAKNPMRQGSEAQSGAYGTMLSMQLRGNMKGTPTKMRKGRKAR